MFDFLRKIQGIGQFWRKVIVFSVIAILALLIGNFILENFHQRVKSFKGEESFFDTSRLQDIKGEIGSFSQQIKDREEKLEHELKKIEEMSKETATSATSSQ